MPQRIPVPFGAGIDRATGVMLIEPTAFAELRNVLLGDGTAELRPGLQLRDTLTAPATDVVGLAAFRAQGRGVAVRYDAVTRNVSLLRVNNRAQNPVVVGAWFTAPVQGGRPRAVLAESWGRLFAAHDQHYFIPNDPSNTLLRGPTYVYDPKAVTPWEALTADLDRDTVAETLRFRGVVPYLTHLVGWGYGNAAEPDRPELVRFSMPGRPREFDPEHFVVIGQRDEPVLACVPGTSSLLVFKESATYEVVGRSRAEYQPQLLDPLFGVVGARLAVNVGGVVYGWSLEGPRAYGSGRPSIDLAVPLALGAPEPSDLATMGPVEDGFAVYLPVHRCVLFCFPSDADTRTRVYCLNLRHANDPKWTYWEFGQRVLSAATFSSTALVVPGPPSAVTFSEVTSQSVRIAFTNPVQLGGDELEEVWTRDVTVGGPWVRASERPVGPANGPSTLVLDRLLPLHQYQVAVRYTAGALRSTGAEGADPGAWPQQPTASVTLLAAPNPNTVTDPGLAVLSCEEAITPGGGGFSTYATRQWGWRVADTGNRAWELWRATGPDANAVPGAEMALLLAAGANGGAWAEPGTPGGSDLWQRTWIRYRLGEGSWGPFYEAATLTHSNHCGVP